MKLPSAFLGRPIQQMCMIAQPRRRLLQTVTAACLLVPGTAYLHAQTAPSEAEQRLRRPDKFSILPPTAPTRLPAQPVAVATTPAPNTLPTPIAASPVSGEQPSSRARRAVVTYANGQLNVRAADSSLNQILRAISRETGLKITGGVQDQRVFGNYGPASTSTVLATLLDGTGTNLLLLEGDATTSPELTLTPRGGGATPPNPNAPGFDDGQEPEAAPLQQMVQQPNQQPAQQQPMQQQMQQPGVSSPSATTMGPQSVPQPDNNVNGSPLNTSPTASTFPTTDSVPTDTLPTPSTTPSSSGIVDAPNPPAPGSTTGTAPNGTVTPEQIYQQLLQRQQQQQRTATPATPVEQPQ